MALFNRWFHILDNNPEMTLIFGVIGLFLLAASWWLLRRRRERGQLMRSRLGVITVALLAGIFLFGSTCYTLARWPAAFDVRWNTLFRGDYANAEAMRDLQNERFERPEHAAQAGDWAQWRGPNRDGINTDTRLRTDWQANPPKVLWRQPVAEGYSSVVVSGGRVYVQDKAQRSERVHCLDAETGKPIWMHESAVEDAGLTSHKHGPRATPTVHDGRVYTVGAMGRFLCLEARPAGGTAKVLWEHDLLSEFDAKAPSWGVSCSPLVEGELVVVQPGGEKGSLAAFHRVTGTLAWTALEDLSGYSSPIAATVAGVRQIIAFTGEGVAGVRPADGKQLWYYPWKTSYYANVATPIVAGDYVFISSDYGTGCALLKLTVKGDPLGETLGDRLTPTPVYIKRNKLMRNHQSTCVLDRGFLYGFDTQGTGGRVLLRCVDLRTGEERWATDWAAGDRGKGVPLLADGHLLLLYEDGTLRLAEATPDAYREKASFRPFAEGHEVWALPALAAGRLYLRNHKEVVCVEVGR